MELKESMKLIFRPIAAFLLGFAAIFITAASFPEFMGTAICLTIGAVFILVSDTIKQLSIRSKESCTYSTIGVISGYERPNSDNSFFPVYTYQYGGNEYTVRSNISSSRHNPGIGEEVDIFLNPDNPQESYLELLTKSTDIICKVFRIVGVVLIITSIALALIISLVEFL